MSLDKPPKNKMIDTPPTKKGWHFPSDGVYAAAFIEAETIHEAEAIYHKTKRLLFSLNTGGPIPGPMPQSTTIISDEHEAIN